MLLVAGLIASGPARAANAVACGGFALLGGAQLNCSHVAPTQPPQFCTFSWSLLTTENTPTVVQGSFELAPGATNVAAYQGAGFSSALSNPIVLCQGKKAR